MKIISLTMQAFGPFLKQQTIDFSTLGNSGICLIHGETGSGKTTIFDGITYAIFGQTSGGLRDGKAMRCESAPDEVKTFVELVFEDRSKRYTITRFPGYEKINSKGGISKVYEQAILVMPNGKTIDKLNDVNAKIRDVIGINADQFRQIALIAQGKFIDMLNAGTADRQKIFRQIFNTEKYQELMTALADEVKFIQENINKLEERYKTNLSNAKIDNANDFENIGKLDDLLNALNEKINDDEKERESGKIEKDALEKTINDLTKELTEANDYIATEKSIEAIKQHLAAIEQNILDAKNALDAAKAKESDIEKNKENIAILNSKKDEFLKLEEKKNELKTFNSKLWNLQNILKNNKNSEKALEDNINKYTEELKDLENIEVKKVKNEHNIFDIEKKLSTLNNLQDKFSKREVAVKAFYISRDLYERKKAEYDKEDKILGEMNEAYIDGYSYILARNLVDNEPCPVCGSKEHPKPAISETEPPSKENIDKHSALVASLKKECENSKIAYDESKANALSIHDSMKKSFEELYNTKFNDFDQAKHDLELDINNNKQSLKTLQLKLDDINKKCEKKNQLTDILPKCQEKLNSIKTNIQDNEKELATIEANILSTKQIICDKEANLPYDSLDKMNHAISEMTSLCNKYENDIQVAEQNKNTLEQDKSKLNGQLSTLKGRIASKPRPDIQALNDADKDAKGKKIICEERLSLLQGQISSNIQCKKNIANIKIAYQNALSAYSTAKNLSDVANERNMDLESFVQAGYFDNILSRANTHLQKMSEGKYSLVRESESQDNRTKFGLNLDIYNHNNGKQRSVKTLSGGESFNAALSLALGMSELVQSNAGAIQLNSLFIDEGFGTLDKDSLDNAIKTVMGISTSNRMVYVISHVSELKERIDKQIIVKRVSNDRKVEILV